MTLLLFLLLCLNYCILRIHGHCLHIYRRTSAVEGEESWLGKTQSSSSSSPPAPLPSSTLDVSTRTIGRRLIQEEGDIIGSEGSSSLIPDRLALVPGRRSFGGFNVVVERQFEQLMRREDGKPMKPLKASLIGHMGEEEENEERMEITATSPQTSSDTFHKKKIKSSSNSNNSIHKSVKKKKKRGLQADEEESIDVKRFKVQARKLQRHSY